MQQVKLKHNLRELTDSLVKNFVDYKGGPFIVLADGASEIIGLSIVGSANALDTEVRKSIVMYDLDEFREGNPLTSLPDGLREKLESRLTGPDEHHNVVLYVNSCLNGEQPMRAELAKVAGARGKIGGLPNCTEDVLAAGYHPDNKPAFSQELFDFMQQENEVLLTCDRGSEVTVVMDHQTYQLVNSNGVLVPGKYGNPIPAEVFAHPASADGKLVVSGSYGPLMGYEPFVGNHEALLDALDKDPVTMTMKDGKVIDIQCGNEDIQQFIRTEVFEKDTEHGMKIGEFGLPANLYVLARQITGNLMIDEKGRVHIAHGHGYQNRTGCRYDTSIHGDGLVACATLKSQRLGKPFMINNQYSPEIFKTLSE